MFRGMHRDALGDEVSDERLTAVFTFPPRPDRIFFPSLESRSCAESPFLFPLCHSFIRGICFTCEFFRALKVSLKTG